MKTPFFILLQYMFVTLLFCFVVNQSVCAQKLFIVVTTGDTFLTKEQALKAYIEQQQFAEMDKSSETSGGAKTKHVCILIEPPHSSFDDLYYSVEVKRTATHEDGKVDVWTGEYPDKIKVIDKTTPAAGINASRPRILIKETAELFPSGETGTRSFRSVKHKSGLITVIESGTNDRVVEVTADLSVTHLNKGTDVSDAGRRFVQTLGKRDDDAGHVIANRLGGSGGANMDNLFPQLANINRGEFAQWEAQIAAWVNDLKNKVSIQIKFNYDPKSSRATSIDYFVTVNGIMKRKTFSN